MSHTDPIADMFVRLKNASARHKENVSMPASRVKMELASLLKKAKFIDNFEIIEKDGKNTLVIVLRYVGKLSAIQGYKRYSKPGQRVYTSVDDIKRYVKYPQTLILSTSQGIMTSREATAKKAGGEVICSIW